MSTEFGRLSDGRAVHATDLRNDALFVRILTHGARIQDLRLAGTDHALTLGSPDVAAYEGPMVHFGAIVGPVANRISDASARIDGRTYRFEANQDGRHTLHAGGAGTQKKLWTVTDEGPQHVALALDLPDGEGGFPGNRRLTATYRLDGATLVMELGATTDAPTLMNLANHGYWTLNGGPDWGGQSLQVAAGSYLPISDDILPTGEVAPVAGTPYDLRAFAPVTPGTAPKLDTNFCLADARRPCTRALRLAAPEGPSLEIATTEPGIQVFDMGTNDTGDAPTLHGRPYGPYTAFAFEPQFWPDAPGRDGWPDITLRPGEEWRQETRYKFSPSGP